MARDHSFLFKERRLILKIIKLNEATYERLVSMRRGMDTFDDVVIRALKVSPDVPPPDSRQDDPE